MNRKTDQNDDNIHNTVLKLSRKENQNDVSI